MLEMKLEHGAIALARGAHAVGVALDQVAGEQQEPLLGLADLLLARALVGELELVALPAQADIEVELVERGLDLDRTLHVAVRDDAFLRLRGAEDRALDHVAPRAPFGALLLEEGADRVVRTGPLLDRDARPRAHADAEERIEDERDQEPDDEAGADERLQHRRRALIERRKD